MTMTGAGSGGLSEGTVDRAIRLLAVVLPIGLIVVGAFYWLDRHPQAGPSLNDRAVAYSGKFFRMSAAADSTAS